MSIRSAIPAFLGLIPEVKALVGDRVYPLYASDDIAPPFIITLIEGYSGEGQLSGPPTLHRYDVQLALVGDDYAALGRVVDAIEALSNTPFMHADQKYRAVLETQREIFGVQDRLYQIQLDMTFTKGG